jgi:hypothetical protein
MDSARRRCVTLAAQATLVEAAFRAQKDDQSRLFKLAAADAPARSRAIRSIWMRTSSSPWRSATWASPTARLRGICKGMRAKASAVSIARWGWTGPRLGAGRAGDVAPPNRAVRRPCARRRTLRCDGRKGLAHCVPAPELAPESIGLRFGCGVSLLALGRDADGRPAAELMRTALRLPPRDAAKRLVQRPKPNGCSARLEVPPTEADQPREPSP